MQTTPNDDDDDDEQVEYERWFAARGRTNNKLLPDSANDMEWLEEIEHLRKSGPLPAKLERLEREIYEDHGIAPSDDA
jgi:hypothetical protein